MFSCVLDTQVHSFPAWARGFLHPLSFICHFDRLKASVAVSGNTPLQPGNRIPMAGGHPLNMLYIFNICTTGAYILFRATAASQETNFKSVQHKEGNFSGSKTHLIQSAAFGNSSVNYREYENRVGINENMSTPSQDQECSLCPLK